MPVSENKKYERLRWGCRRGMLELDLLLLPFFDNYFSQLTTEQKATFEELLTYQDPELYAWFIGTEKPSDEDQAKNKALSELIAIIKDRVTLDHDKNHG